MFICFDFGICFSRYSSVIEDSSADNLSYTATTSTTSRVNPQYLTKTCYRSNSQNRVLSPTFDTYKTSRFWPERTSSLASSGSASSLRLDNFVTLRRRSHAYSTAPASACSSPMVLSPSATRQFNIPPSSSREGSVTPRFSHSCSNASLVSESAAD